MRVRGKDRIGNHLGTGVNRGSNRLLKEVMVAHGKLRVRRIIRGRIVAGGRQKGLSPNHKQVKVGCQTGLSHNSRRVKCGHQTGPSHNSRRAKDGRQTNLPKNRKVEGRRRPRVPKKRMNLPTCGNCYRHQIAIIQHPTPHLEIKTPLLWKMK